MNKDRFIKKFELRDKVVCDEIAKNTQYIEIDSFEKDTFYGHNEKGQACETPYSYGEFKLYEERE